MEWCIPHRQDHCSGEFPQDRRLRSGIVELNKVIPISQDFADDEIIEERLTDGIKSPGRPSGRATGFPCFGTRFPYDG